MIYDFTQGRAGEHARNFLRDWQGRLDGLDGLGLFRARLIPFIDTLATGLRGGDSGIKTL